MESVALDGSRRVLIVDDEKNVSTTLGQIFQGRGYEVRSALSAEQAIELATNWVPELALLDVGLPGMNGVDLAILLLDQHPNCRVLLFSGRPDSEDLVNKAAERGRSLPILAKPVHPDVLLAWAKGLPSAELSA